MAPFIKVEYIRETSAYEGRKKDCGHEERKAKSKLPRVVQLLRAELRFNQLMKLQSPVELYYGTLFLLTCLGFCFLICNIDVNVLALQLVGYWLPWWLSW